MRKFAAFSLIVMALCQIWFLIFRVIPEDRRHAAFNQASAEFQDALRRNDLLGMRRAIQKGCDVYKDNPLLDCKEPTP